MTIEEKAKRYDKALEVAKRKLCFDKAGLEDSYTPNDLYEIFPELKESEDDRIRKELTDYIKRKLENSCSPTPSKNILANWISWLEKQGGQKVVGWTAEDEEELEIALNTLEEAGQYSSAKWLRNVCLVPKTIQKPNPYSGTSFDYNGHIWGMCARDNGVEILFDGELKAFLSLEKSFIYHIHPQPELPKTD